MEQFIRKGLTGTGRLVARRWAAFSVVAALVLSGTCVWAWLDYRDYEARNVAIEQTVADGSKVTLRADHHAAEFTYGLLLFSAFGTLFSVAGIAVIARTLHATREMTKTTQAASENQSRAYLHADGLEAVNFGFGGELHLRVLNTGQTPVRWFEVTARGQGMSGNDLNSFRVESADLREQGRWHALGAGQPQTVNLHMGELDWQSAFDRQQLGLVFAVYGTVRYADIYGREFVSDFAFFTTHVSWGPRSDPSVKFMKPRTWLRSYVDVTPAG